MGKRWYGNVCNRVDEGKNFTNRDIQVGDDITMYHWSDRSCYYITKVIDQKHIFVKKYDVVADKKKGYGMGHQNWLYFKTAKESHRYINDWYDEHPEDKWDTYEKLDENPKEFIEEEWVFRNNKWKECFRFTKKSIDEIIKRDGWCRASFNEKEQKKLDEGKEVCKYSTLQPISFGVRDYYYDWEL